MKETKMKTKLFKLFCCLLLSMCMVSCSSNDETKPLADCGCESATLFTIPNEAIQEVPIEEQKTGLLFFKRPENIDGFYDDEEYNNRFWILQNSPCNSCNSHLIVCNQEVLGTNYDFLKKEGVYDSIPISFSGQTKKTCKAVIALPTNYSYNEIVINSIENK